MVHLHMLWLPIVVSSVIVFFLSFLFHTVLPIHKNDFVKLPDEDKVMDALRPLRIPPGDYMMPRPSSMAAMKSPEFAKKRNDGPVGIMTIMPNGAYGMGKSLGLWFVYLLVVGVFTAYVCSRAVEPGAHYLRVFRFAGVTAFACYGMATWQQSIWYQRKLSATLANNFDALIYALFTAGVFGWLWPR